MSGPCNSYVIPGDETSGPCLHPAGYLAQEDADDGGIDELPYCACHYGEPHDPAECAPYSSMQQIIWSALDRLHPAGINLARGILLEDLIVVSKALSEAGYRRQKTAWIEVGLLWRDRVTQEVREADDHKIEIVLSSENEIVAEMPNGCHRTLVFSSIGHIEFLDARAIL